MCWKCSLDDAINAQDWALVKNIAEHRQKEIEKENYPLKMMQGMVYTAPVGTPMPPQWVSISTITPQTIVSGDLWIDTARDIDTLDGDTIVRGTN